MRPHAVARTLAVIALVQVCGVLPGVAEKENPMSEADRPVAEEDARWKAVETFVASQQMEEASSLVEEILASARDEKRTEDWLRALVRRSDLRLVLHGFETAFTQLREGPWPEDPEARALLHLVEAEVLESYLDAYGWEIGQRERIASEETAPLDQWTRGQVAEEIERSFQRAWSLGAWDERPLGDLARYFEPGDYPARIRGTRRDVLAYLWAEWLRDSSSWTPEEENGVFALDVEGLIRGEAISGDDAHPLERLAGVLGELERWHEAGGRSEAAFEAFRVRLEALDDHLEVEADLARLREVLEARLARMDPALPWTSMGQLTLARWTRVLDVPDREIRARQVALDCAERHPDSVGGQSCAALVRAIESPEFRLTSMQQDGRGQRSLHVSHRNLERLYLRAWRLDVEQMVRENDDWNLLPRWREIPDQVMRRPHDAAWEVDLPATPDFRSHTTYVTPDLDRLGHWVVVASADPSFRTNVNRLGAVHLLLTDMVTTVRSVEGRHEVRVLEGATGAPVEGARVDLWRRDHRVAHRKVLTGTTGDDGRVLFDLSGQERSDHLAIVKWGDDVSRTGWLQRYGLPTRDAATSGSLVYTDRAVYRPAQKILWKVVAYEGRPAAGRLETVVQGAGTVRLLDANREEVAALDVTTNRFGTASGEFLVEPGRLLGGWQVVSSWGGRATVRVEEYERPTFEVEIGEPPEALRLNREATLTGLARYYFGLPVTDGSVVWRVKRTPVAPPWWRWWGWVASGGEQIVEAGKTVLSSDGTFEIRFTPVADEREAERPGLSYRYELEADVTDAGGETRSGRRATRVGFVAVEALVEPPAGILSPTEETEITVVRQDLDGTPRAGEGSWRLTRLQVPGAPVLPAERGRELSEEEAAWATEGDRLRPRWESDVEPAAHARSWDDGEVLGSGALEHPEDGRAHVELPLLEAGWYRFHVRTEDPWGAVFETSRDLRVADEGAKTPLALLFEPASTSVDVGGTARLLVGSGFAGQEMTVELFQDHRRFERFDLVGTGSLQIVEVPISERLRGGFSVRASLVRDHQRLERLHHLTVPWTDRKLEVSFETFRDRLRPGQNETWTVRVRGVDEETLAQGTAEVLASMFDRSLDLFGPYDPPRISALYPTRFGVGPVLATLGAEGEVWQQSDGFGFHWRAPTWQETRLVAISSYGIGGPGRMPRMMMMKSAAGIPPSPSPPAPAAEARLAESFDGVAEEIVVVTTESPLAEAGGETEAGLRTDFAETAFWEPHLVLGNDGLVEIQFDVPDSVTDWHVWVHAVTRDLRGGSLHATARTVQDLMVRPSLPRFLRQEDRAEIEVVVDNAGEVPLEGEVTFDLVDPVTGVSVAERFALSRSSAGFALEPGRSTSVAFGLRAPDEIGEVAVVARARAGELADGEKRPLPILPSRFQLVQSRFAALRGGETRTLRFEDLLADDDPTRIDDGLAVTVDAQLFTSVLRALPYLIEYPYECTEQTLNRYLSSAIVSSVFEGHPAIASLAKQLAERETLLDPWEADDPNRRMLLEETPWVRQSAGGGVDPERLIPILDPDVAATQRREALRKLEKMQTSSGGFPWWAGGPPSPYMTMYLLQGFSRALEVGDEPPREMIRKAWAYLHRHYVDDIARRMVERDCCWEIVTFLGHVLSSYPDESWTGGVFSEEERATLLDFSFRHWKEHSPLLKSLLARTLHRASRTADAGLVWDSVMDSAKTDRDLGTYWAPEDRAWLWYQDTVETHAVALRTLSELDPDDARRDGLVQWLMLDKKLGHWKSTRATAEAIYALVHSLDRDDKLGRRDVVRVRLGERSEELVFEPEDPNPRARVEVAGGDVEAGHGEIVVEAETPNLVFASATWRFSTEQLPDAGDADLFGVARAFFRRVLDGDEWTLRPLEDGERLEVGDEVEVRLLLTARHAAEYVHLRDPRGAGFEPVGLTSGYRWMSGLGVYEEVRDSGVNYFFERLPAGEVTFRHRLRASTAGTFRVAPATVQSMYAPEFAAYSSGRELEIGAAGSSEADSARDDAL